jgi:hypothetical protein
MASRLVRMSFVLTLAAGFICAANLAPASAQSQLSALAMKFVRHLGEEGVRQLVICLIKECATAPDPSAVARYRRLSAADREAVRKSFSAPEPAAVPFAPDRVLTAPRPAAQPQ